MIVFRSTIFFILMVLVAISYATFFIIVGWFISYDRLCRFARSWSLVSLYLLKIICNLDFVLDGVENIPEKSCIFMSKHQSAWETIAFRSILPHQQTWVLKRELMWVPFFGWALRLFQPIAIDRSSGRTAVKQVLEQGVKSLESGRPVIIFPEGTRVAPGERKKYGVGGALLAHKSGFPIIPISHNAGVFWKRRGLNKYPGTIHVIIGKPISSKNRKAAEISREVEEWIETRQARLSPERDK